MFKMVEGGSNDVLYQSLSPEKYKIINVVIVILYL